MVMITLRLQPWGCRADIEQRTRPSEESQGTQRLGVGSVSCMDLEITVIAMWQIHDHLFLSSFAIISKNIGEDKLGTVVV